MSEVKVLTSVKLRCLIPVEEDTIGKIQLALPESSANFPYSGLEFEYYPPLKQEAKDA